MRLLHIPLKTGRKLHVHEPYKSLSLGGYNDENTNKTTLAKVKIKIQQCHVKKNVSKLKNSWTKSFTKKNHHSSFYTLLTIVQYVLTIVRTITRAISVTSSKHKFFLYSSCLKPLRSTYLPSYPHVLTTFICRCLCLGE